MRQFGFYVGDVKLKVNVYLYLHYNSCPSPFSATFQQRLGQTLHALQVCALVSS